MPTVEVTFSALPVHVRTARLIAAAVARRAGMDAELLDEVRLAVGEACSRAVRVHQRKAPDALVGMSLSVESDGLTITVSDVGPTGEQLTEPDLGELGPDALAALIPEPTTPEPLPDLLPPGFGLAVITGLVENVEVTSDSDGTHVRMSWPAPERPSWSGR